MKIVVPHSLSPEQALKCSKNIIEKLREEHGDRITDIVQTWNGSESDFSFRIAGMSIKGKLHVFPDRIEIYGDLPAAAIFFKGMIEETVKKQAEKMLRNCAKI